MVTITAPGVEIKEVDLSFYDFPQPAEETQNVLIPGFANKGLNNMPYEFTNDNTDDDLLNTFGVPTNEAERYFFNACSEAIKRDKVVLYAVRIPYLNTATQNYNAVKYSFSGEVATPDAYDLSAITESDKSLKSGLVLKLDEVSAVVIKAEDIEGYRRQEKVADNNSFLIIDKTQDVYSKIPVDAQHTTLSSRYLLGVMPVVTTAANALYFQNLIETNDEELLSTYEPVGDIASSTAELSASMMVYPPNSLSLKKNDKSAMTISRFASMFFPTINLNQDGTFARDRLKNIGVVVFKGYLDAENGNKVKYEPVEAFAGSLKSDDVDPVTGVSRFIDDIVNTNSETIEFFSNCFNGDITIKAGPEQVIVDDLRKKAASIYTILMRKASEDPDQTAIDSMVDLTTVRTFVVEQLGALVDGADEDVLSQIQAIKNALNAIDDGKLNYSEIDMLYADKIPVKILGFEEVAAADKTVSYNLILSSLDKIFKKAKNVNEKQIDLVVDAGVSNIAQFIDCVNGGVDPTLNDDGDVVLTGSCWCKAYDPVAYEDDGTTIHSAVALWDICTRVAGSTASMAKEHTTEVWQQVLKKYDDFCKTRKDCMFFADGLRPLCVKGNRKLVSPTDLNATVENTILPFVKYITGKIDTSYGAGYCDWYRIVDPTSAVNIWMPPSVKAMCVALDTTNDKFYWSVPAGVNNGRLNPIDPKSKVVVNDIAFNPTVDEAGGIYTKSWNYCTWYRDDGYVLEGQRTFQQRPTAFDRINVRRLFLYLERKVYNACRYFIYEPNTAYTRQRLVDTLTPYFEDAKINGGIFDYRLICDETINTPETIDRNELHVKCAIKPTRAIEFVEVVFMALRTSASFSEVGM